MDQIKIFEFYSKEKPVSAYDIMTEANAFLADGYEAISGSMETVVYKEVGQPEKVFYTTYSLLYGPKEA